MRKSCGNGEAMYQVIKNPAKENTSLKKTNVVAEITMLTCKHCGEEIYDKQTEMENDIILFDDYKLKASFYCSKEIIDT